MATRILLAADDDAITSELAPLLRRAGFEVGVAEDGHAAQRLAGQIRPDCIVLDVLMPACEVWGWAVSGGHARRGRADCGVAARLE